VRWLAYRPLGGGATSLLGWGVLATAPYNGSKPILYLQHSVQITTYHIYCFNHPKKMSVTLNRNSLTAPVFTKFSKLKQELQVSNSNALMTTIFIFW